MQGRHQTGCVRTTCASPSGRVAVSLVGPNIAVTLTPAAAARCIAPESLVTSAAALRQHAGQRRQIGAADDDVERRRSDRRLDLHRRSRASAALPTSTQVTPSAASDVASSREIRRRPALRAAVRRARRERDQRRRAVPAGVRQQPRRRVARGVAARRRAVRSDPLGKAERAARGAGSTRPDAAPAGARTARVSSRRASRSR